MRALLPGDLAAVETALYRMMVKNPNRQMRFANLPTAMEYVCQAALENRVVVVDGYFIMFSVGPAWFTKAHFLVEDIILRIHPTTQPVEVAIAALDTLRVQHECAAVVVGDTQIGVMEPKYLAAGFTRLGTQLIKE